MFYVNQRTWETLKDLLKTTGQVNPITWRPISDGGISTGSVGTGETQGTPGVAGADGAAGPAGATGPAGPAGAAGAAAFADQVHNTIFSGPPGWTDPNAPPAFRRFVPQDLELGVDKQSGTTYTIAVTDNGKEVVFNTAADVAVTLPVPSTMPTGFNFVVKNNGTGLVSFVIPSLYTSSFNLGNGLITLIPGNINLKNTVPPHNNDTADGQTSATDIIEIGQLNHDQSSIGHPGDDLIVRFYWTNFAGVQLGNKFTLNFTSIPAPNGGGGLGYSYYLNPGFSDPLYGGMSDAVHLVYDGIYNPVAGTYTRTGMAGWYVVQWVTTSSFLVDGKNLGLPNLAPGQGLAFYTDNANYFTFGGKGFAWRGPWDAAVDYNLDDAVSRSGSSYIALTSNVGVDPATDGGVNWDVMAAEGSVGATGATGATGAAGTFAGRTTASHTTASLVPDATEETTITMAKSFFLMKVVASDFCRVELYSTAAAMSADSGRAIGTLPAAGTAHGVIFDYAVTSTSGLLTFILSPAAYGASLEASPSADISMRITNKSNVTETITVTLTYDPLETP